MKTRESPLLAAILASAPAGPAFVLSLAAAHAYSLIPQPISIDPIVLAMSLVLLVPSAIVGFLVSFLPNAIGTHILSIAGEISETARAPLFWIGVGAASGFGIAILFGAFPDSGPATFALVLTSAICAGICRARIRWES